MKKVLLIENETDLARYVGLELQDQSYDVTMTHRAREGLKLATTSPQQWDVILLALLLEEMDGIQLCRQIRQHSMVPIVMMTSKDSVQECIQALDAGADDYMIKPFAIEELLARLRSLFRRINYERGTAEADPTLFYHDLILDPDRQDVRQKGRWIHLTPREYDLLYQLMAHPKQVCSREHLLENVWGYDHPNDSNVVDVYIRYLRNKLDPTDSHRYIQTVRGKGYLLSEH